MIFVSVGTERFPFDRLIRAVDETALRVHGEPVFVQLGSSRYTPQRCRWVRVLPYRELVEQIRQARIVITHAGAGLLMLCARLGTVPIAVPRRRRFREHVDDHQVELATRLAQLGHVVLAEHPDRIGALLMTSDARNGARPSGGALSPTLAKTLAEYLGAI